MLETLQTCCLGCLKLWATCLQSLPDFQSILPPTKITKIVKQTEATDARSEVLRSEDLKRLLAEAATTAPGAPGHFRSVERVASIAFPNVLASFSTVFCIQVKRHTPAALWPQSKHYDLVGLAGLRLQRCEAKDVTAAACCRSTKETVIVREVHCNHA